MNTVLVVEDEENLALLYQSVLTRANFTVLLAENGQEALAIMECHHIDLLITDIMMNKIDGFELTQLVRDFEGDVPILMITAKDSFEDKKRGFRLGIDDYMVKPIDVKEMLLRVEALLRRAKINHSNMLIVGDTKLNQENYTVSFADYETELPQKEFLLLYKLLAYPNKIFTRQQLMDEIWGLDSHTDERTIDVHIRRLRDRFKENKDYEITTIRGLGYKAVIHS
ncbi:MAG: response regulator transcription factor [Enterococcus sp.]